MLLQELSQAWLSLTFESLLLNAVCPKDPLICFSDVIV